MIDRRTVLKGAVALGALASVTQVRAEPSDPMKVVATFSILANMVERIGGSHVAVTSLVGPNGDAHVLPPSPADARAVSEARVLIANGLGFEGWLDRLVDASDFTGQRVEATEGVSPIAFEDDDHHDDEHHDDHDGHANDDGEHAEHSEGHDDHGEHAKHDEYAGHKHDVDHVEHGAHYHHDHGDFDPHAWQSLRNAVIYANNIAAALTRADPEHASDYEDNRSTYVSEIKALDTEIRDVIAALAEEDRTVVTSHDAFQYFGRDYGLTFLAPQGLGTESEASAKDVARMIQQIRKKKIKAVFIENVADPRLLKQIAAETGARIGGKLYPGALSEPGGPAGTYLDMMRHNAMTLAGALSS